MHILVLFVSTLQRNNTEKFETNIPRKRIHKWYFRCGVYTEQNVLSSMSSLLVIRHFAIANFYI